ncbi:MAG: prepilin-type N-terminal cleavage/methylation domain-containing protein [Ruminococcus sp.]|nr:prepilin-type N-terminal cleavage/methylation domain-containing protein [Ruminococcus sp.]
MKNRKKLKGFTLIELIIVLAIFGIILSVVMSLIDPVSKVMKRASTKERTAAYSDNICEYITNSVTYARFVRVYEGGFVQKNDLGEIVAIAGDNLLEQERNAAKLLIEQMLNDAVDCKGNPVRGTVHVLKFINDDIDSTGDGNDDLFEGHVYDSSYTFTAGTKLYDNEMNVVDISGQSREVSLKKEDVTPDDTEFNPENNKLINRDLINPEHYNEYSYYFSNGYYTLDPIDDPDCYSKTDGLSESMNFAAVPIDYYSCFRPISKISGPEFSLNINVVSYKKDDKTNGKIKKVTYKPDEHTEGEDVTLFRSPAHLKAASMSLINASNFDRANYVTYMKPERDVDENYEPSGTYKKATGTDYGEAYETWKAESGNDDIYIVYIMPNEMSDVAINYNSNQSGPEATPDPTDEYSK